MLGYGEPFQGSATADITRQHHHNETPMPLDSLRALGARLLLNKYFEDIGVVSTIEIDAEADHAVLQVVPKGEMYQVRLEVNYRVDPDAFVLVSFACEREWIANTLNRFASGLRIDIENSHVQSLLEHLL